MPRPYTLYLLAFLALWSGHRAQAQSRLLLIRASSTRVAIRDGEYLNRNAWALSPKVKPDVYTADRTRQAKWVTFYTDLDSIRFRVKPGTHADFLILLNGRDTCYTRVVSALPRRFARPAAPTAPDTIPFTLTAEDAIAVRAVVNQQDTLLLHFDTGAIEVRLTRDALLRKTHLLPNQAAAQAGTARPDYARLRPVTSLQLGTLRLPTAPVQATDLTAAGMDGRFGYALFEGKQVAIDYDQQRLLVYSHLPRRARRGYARTKLFFQRSFPCARGAFQVAGTTYAGDFSLDTGTNQAVIVDSAWTSQQHFPRTLPLLRTLVLRNPRGTKFETRVVLAPAFSLAGFQATDVPTNLLGFANPAGYSVNYLGGGFLKHFNLILDFAHDVLYLRPNTQWGQPFRKQVQTGG